jgi:hypothetical protein
MCQITPQNKDNNSVLHYCTKQNCVPVIPQQTDLSFELCHDVTLRN